MLQGRPRAPQALGREWPIGDLEEQLRSLAPTDRRTGAYSTTGYTGLGDSAVRG